MELSIICKRLQLNRVTLNQARKRFCIEDEENPVAHHRKGLRLARHGY